MALVKKLLNKFAYPEIIMVGEETVTTDNIHIENSYQIRLRSQMREYIDGYLRKKYTTEQCQVLERSTNSLVAEWCSHNLLFDLGIATDRTKDVDLNIIKWYEDLLYRIVSAFYWPRTKPTKEEALRDEISYLVELLNENQLIQYEEWLNNKDKEL